MSVLLVRHSDFSQGDGGWIDKGMLPPGFFHGENVVVFRNGAVGPRSGILDLNAVGLTASGTVPTVIGYVDNGDATPDYIWIVKGTVCSRIPVYDGSGRVLTGQTWVNCAGSVGVNPLQIGDSVDLSETVTAITIMADKIYELKHQVGANGTLAALAGSPGGRTIEVFGEFLVVGGLLDNPNRLQFSKRGDFNTWPAGNFFDLMPTGSTGMAEIIAMHRLRDQLLVWTNMGQLFIITGVLDNDPVHREFMPADKMSGPAWPHSVARTREGRMWWTRREEIPALEDQEYDLPSATPVSFTGGQREEHVEMAGYLRNWRSGSQRRSDTAAVAGRSESSFALMDYKGDSYRALLSRGDAWTRHHFDYFVPYRMTGGTRGDVFAMDETDDPHLLVWQFELERPPWFHRGSVQEALPYATTDDGTPIENWFATPEFRHPGAMMVRVRRLEVIVSNYTTNDPALPDATFDVFVQQYDTLVDTPEVIDAAGQVPADNDPALTLAAATSFSQPAVTGGVEHRTRATFMLGANEIPAGAIRVLIKNMRNCAIHSIDVYGDLVPDARP